MSKPSSGAEDSALAPALRRHVVRAKGAVLNAVPVVQDRWVALPNGEETRAHTGDWLITRGSQIVDVCDTKRLGEVYESAEPIGVVIRDLARSRLERALGIGSTETPEHLATAVERLARLKVGDCQIDFTPGQWEQLAHRAGKMGISVEALVKRIVDRITADLWTS